MFQHHLTSASKGSALYHSGRGVRVRILSQSEVDALPVDAWKVLDKDASVAEFNQLVRRNGVKKMIAEVTAEPFPYAGNDHPAEFTDPATWRKLTDEQLDREFAKLFTPKDVDLLNQIYNRMHSITPSSLDEIEGKAI